MTITLEAAQALREVFGYQGKPDDLTALDWLEQEHGYEWCREERLYGVDLPNGRYYSIYDHEGGDVALNEYPMPFPNPSSLILAIAAHHKQTIAT